MSIEDKYLDEKVNINKIPGYKIIKVTPPKVCHTCSYAHDRDDDGIYCINRENKKLFDLEDEHKIEVNRGGTCLKFKLNSDWEDWGRGFRG